jgi:hypothetical protein
VIFFKTLRRLKCEYYSKGLASSSSSQTNSTSTSRWDSNKPYFKCIPSNLPTNPKDYKLSMPSTDIWPSTPSIPAKGDDMHPPQELIAGVHPGKGWHYNSIKHWDYSGLEKHCNVWQFWIICSVVLYNGEISLSFTERK